MACASNAWTTAAKPSTEPLLKAQNASLRLITGGMKTTPINAMAGTAGLMSLQERRIEKLLHQSEKMKRFPSHPLHSKLQAPTKKTETQKLKPLRQGQCLADRNQPVEPLQDFDDWSLDATPPPVALDIPGIQSKDQFLDAELKLLTLEALERDYPSTTWTRVNTDGSAENAVSNGGGGA
ncbi:uncharacterized protein LOC143284978 [Babylonia areolata]|uniref:uncharacterized protein LOC143284978 n=1 Tax=Babylonia areolata TaxID=304850 RepID=UPI003FD1D23B